MTKPINDSRNYFIPIIICLFFFATAKFYFLPILGIGKQLLYLIIFLVPIYVIVRFNYFQIILIKRNVILVTLYCLILSFLYHLNIQWATLLIITAILASALLYSHQKTFDLAVKLIMTVLAFFSILVIIQAIMYIIDSSIFDVPYEPLIQDFTDNPDHIQIKYPIHYLGWWTSGRVHLFGIELPRFKSFASEPSILVSIFLMPGLLGLTYKGFIKILSCTILFFSIVLASAGTIYLAMAFGVVSYIILFICSKIKRRSTRSIFIWGFIFSMFLMIFMIVSSDVPNMLRLIDDNLYAYSNYSSMLGQAGHKAESRLMSNHITLELLISNPFGYDLGSLGYYAGSKLAPTNLLFDYGIRLGFLGILLCSLIYTRMIKNLIILFFHKVGLFQKIIISLILGTIIQMLAFTGYGWTSPSGLLMTVIMYRRIQDMLRYKEMKNKWIIGNI